MIHYYLSGMELFSRILGLELCARKRWKIKGRFFLYKKSLPFMYKSLLNMYKKERFQCSSGSVCVYDPLMIKLLFLFSLESNCTRISFQNL
jgi:hypothetical protein